MNNLLPCLSILWHILSLSYLSLSEDWYKFNGANIGNAGIYFKQKPILPLGFQQTLRQHRQDRRKTLLRIQYINYRLEELCAIREHIIVKFDLIQS